MFVYTRAPYRIFDTGGWSDTSFMPGGRGACCNVAVNLYVYIDFEPDNSAELTIWHRANGKKETIALPVTQKPATLAEAAAGALKLSVRDGGSVTVESESPPGSGLGGSASYSVALLAALKPALLQDKHKLATLAQELETKWLGNSCGTQDQMAAAFGGVSFSEIAYPSFTHEAVEFDGELKKQIEDSLLLVYTGQAHFSSEMHHTVVAELEAGNQTVVQAFHRIKQCAQDALAALQAGDISAYKHALNANWQAQKDLHPEVTTHAIEELEAVVREIDPRAAFKGSGAGGGGSVGLLVDPAKHAQMVEEIHARFPAMMVWESLMLDEEGVRLLDEPTATQRTTNHQQTSAHSL